MLIVFFFILVVMATCITNFAIKRPWLGLAAGTVAGIATGLLYYMFVESLRIRRSPYYEVGLIVSGAVSMSSSSILGVIIAGVRSRRARKATLDPWACTSCGYCLYANQSGVCPECGQTVDMAQIAAANAGVKLDGK